MNANLRTPRSDNELQVATKHVLYELRSLEEQTFLAYSEDGKSTGRNQDLVNALVEGALTHARVLMFFLGWDRGGKPLGQKDDVIWEDFTPTRPPATGSPVITPNIKKDIDKWVGHLTYTRQAAKPQWPLASIARAIRDEVKAVMGSVPRKLLDQDWLPFVAGPVGPTRLDAIKDSESVATGAQQPQPVGP